MTYRFPVLVAAVALVLFGAPAAAQDLQEPDTDDLFAPPHLSVVDGAAYFDRDGSLVPAEAGQILTAGDRLITRTGRLEILFGDGSALHLDQSSTVDLLDDDLLRLVEGRAYLHVAPSDPPFEYRVDTPAASVRTAVPGEYRIVAGPVSELAVARGLASIATSGGSIALRSGEVIQVRPGETPGFALPFNAAAWDPFDRWSQDRRRPRVAAITSAPLQGPLTAYNATLSHNGTWSHHVDHGQVWYPHVAAGWRPFYNGRWTTIAPYGWTWLGTDAWAWPTHYYGNWRVTPAGAWFWVPGVRWRPAAVHWTVTTSHIGWAPWGIDVGLFGFTVIPRSVFAVNVFVPRHVVRVGHSSLRPFVIAGGPPLPHGFVQRRAFGVRGRVLAHRGLGDGGFGAGGRIDDRARRVAQPRRGPSAFVQGNAGRNDARGTRAGEIVRRPEALPSISANVGRRAVERVPDRSDRVEPSRPGGVESLRVPPGFRSRGADQPSRPVERAYPRIDAQPSRPREEARPEPSRPEPPRARERAAPRIDAQPPSRAPREDARPAPSSGDAGGERRAVPRRSRN